jgi:GAF domain-containing protein
VPFDNPMAVTDISAQPMLKDQLDAYREEGIRSMLVVPMRIGHERAGTLVFYYRTTRDFSEVDVQTGQALANLASAAMTTAALYEQERIHSDATEAARRQATFLADVGLSSEVSRLRRDIGHGCQWRCRKLPTGTVDIVNQSGEIIRLAVEHIDPAKVDTPASCGKYPPTQRERCP